MSASETFWVAGTSARPLFNQILPWVALLLAVVVIGSLVLYVLRRQLTRDPSGAAEGFSLHELRELRTSGEITEEEFERARSAMIGRLADGPASAEERQPPEDPTDAVDR